LTLDSTNRPAWLKPSIAAMPPYKGPVTAADFAADRKVRLLHLNESPYPPSPKVIEAIQAHAAALNRYPDIFARPLAEALGERTGLAPGRMVFGCGSDELIHLFCEITIGAGDVAVMPNPTFPRYALSTRILDGAASKVPIDRAGANDADGLIAAVTPRTRIVFCSTPNAPSGGMMTAAAIERLAHGVPADVLLVVDEAYHEFGRHAGGPDVLDIMRRRRGAWAVIRTFSKAYGLGGLRVGYALCGSDDIAEALRRAKLQFNVTTLGQAAALAALGDEAHLAMILDGNARERRRLAEGMARLGLEPMPSAANFVSAEVPCEAATVIEGFRERGILIRDWRDPGYMRHIRVTIGMPDDTDAVIDALAEILASPAARG